MRSFRSRSLIAAFAAPLAFTMGAAHGAEPLVVYAAGSTGGALATLAHDYGAATGQPVELVLGPAGLLLERIERGEHADLFISANLAHPQRLTDEGKAGATVVFARNRVCVTARPDVGLSTANLLDTLLNPAVKIGTSTPHADPGGDYAWQLFEKAGAVRPGATAVLEAKAQQLVGGRTAPDVPAGRNPVKYFMQTHRVDVFVGYCSSHDTKPDPALDQVELPPELAIQADYGMTVLAGRHDDAAYRFAMYLLSPAAQAVLPRYGFGAVGLATPQP
ncbi:substrate-binding domain-containing protein [Burkholderia sp. 22PA0106]|uniref:substrate-binding domain-containing protein n=1 Tax=Burkholderia sp. 22PA0106 TaxID=3237371 RepID=UPI0039C00F94